jgi:plastocyanin
LKLIAQALARALFVCGTGANAVPCKKRRGWYSSVEQERRKRLPERFYKTAGNNIMKRFAWIIGFAAAAGALMVIALSGCSGNSNSTGYGPSQNPGPGAPGANEVWMQSTAFNPASKTVAVGATITWTNKDGIAHTVTSGAPGSPSGAFDSGNMAGGATFSHTFSQAGTFPYYCGIHGAMMTGTITVH